MSAFQCGNWQLRLPLKETPHFIANERRTGSWDNWRKRCYSSECDRAQHREQQTVQSSLLLQQRSIQTKMHKSDANIATWIYQCYASFVSRLFLVSWQRVMKEGDKYRRARLKIACPCGQVKTASLYSSANNLCVATSYVTSLRAQPFFFYWVGLVPSAKQWFELVQALWALREEAIV